MHPATTQKISMAGLSAQSMDNNAEKNANIKIAINTYNSRFSILLLSPFEYKYIIHTLYMIVNRKCDLFITKTQITSGGGTRNHATSPQILAKTQKTFENS